MERRRVVITGIGMISSVGHGREENWRALLAGTNGIAPITAFDTTEYRATFAGEVKGFDPTVAMDPKDARKADYTEVVKLRNEATIDIWLFNTPAALIAANDVQGLQGFEDAPFFNEFTVKVRGGSATRVCQALEQQGIIAGIDLGRVNAEYRDRLLVAVTERHRREDLDRLVEALGRI